MNLFVNIALWGQWDAILSLFLLLTLLAAMEGRRLLVGFWMALSIATKTQAIFALPVLAVYFIARRDWRGIRLIVAGGMIGFLLTYAPMAVKGRLDDVMRVHLGSVDTFPRRTVNAWNIWAFANTMEFRFTDTRPRRIISDQRPVFSGTDKFTYKALGLGLLGTYVLVVLAVAARRRTIGDVVVGVPLCGVAAFMLATQMHERYIAPPAALMTLWLLLPRPFALHFFYWTLLAAANQLLTMARFYHLGPLQMAPVTFENIGAGVAVVNVIALGHLTWLFVGRRFPLATRTLEFPSRPRRPREQPPGAAVSPRDGDHPAPA